VGSPKLIQALGRFLNTRFKPVSPVVEDELLITAGVAAALDLVTWAICNEGDGVLVSRPLYAGFATDVEMRSRAKLLPVSYVRNDREYDPLAVFDAKANRDALETAFDQYSNDGIKVRAVLISKYLPQIPRSLKYSLF
jgi:aspartate/methionine/tyrosine aminotransferase